MTKCLSLFVLATMFCGVVPAMAANGSSVADLTSGPAVRVKNNINYQKYQTRSSMRTYSSNDAGDLYYTKPAKRSDLYKQYQGAESASANTTKTMVRTTRSEKLIRQLNRKYYLAHPFFQPLKGNFGSITDFSYNQNTFDFSLPVSVTSPLDSSIKLNFKGGDWESKMFSIKEDFSYGIPDTVALVAMARFDMADYRFQYDFEDGAAESKMSDDSLSVYGIGAQWRFIDNEKWIATASAYFQHQKNFSNNFVLDLKAGYKVVRSTIYGLGRAWYVDVNENSYGAIAKEVNTAAFYIAYDTDVSSALYFEGGMGVFSVLNEDWTLNVEGVFGAYDWHNQASVKAALGWQPNDWFALNLYAKTSFWDSANEKELNTYLYSPSFGYDSLNLIGQSKLDNVNEMSAGIQAIFHF